MFTNGAETLDVIKSPFHYSFQPATQGKDYFSERANQLVVPKAVLRLRLSWFKPSPWIWKRRHILSSGNALVLARDKWTRDPETAHRATMAMRGREQYPFVGCFLCASLLSIFRHIITNSHGIIPNYRWTPEVYNYLSNMLSASEKERQWTVQGDTAFWERGKVALLFQVSSHLPSSNIHRIILQVTFYNLHLKLTYQVQMIVYIFYKKYLTLSVSSGVSSL